VKRCGAQNYLEELLDERGLGDLFAFRQCTHQRLHRRSHTTLNECIGCHTAESCDKSRRAAILPLTSTALGSVEPHEVAAAAGLMNFIRTLAGAVGTSVVNTVWDDGITRNHAELAGILNDASDTAAAMVQNGLSAAQAMGTIDQVVTSQAIMLSTNHVFVGCAVALAIAACAIWLSPRPRSVDTTGVH
jgi:hypothetical protein